MDSSDNRSSKKKIALELIFTAILAAALFPVSAFFAGFLGFDSLESLIYSHSPEFIFSDEKIEEILQANNGNAELEISGRSFQAGIFHVISTLDLNKTDWDAGAKSAVAILSDFLQSSPWKIPSVKICPAVGQEGAYNGLRILIDPENENMFSIFFHELTHVYLFWSLFPGTPFDCPRWFNEGMAEEFSARISGDSEDSSRINIINKFDIVQFNEISPGFSRSGLHVEIQSRHAFAFFLKRFEKEGIRKIVSGLARARPFRSVFQVEFKQNPEDFEKECFQEFYRTRVLENISEADFQDRVLKTTSIPPKTEFVRSLKSANMYWPQNNVIASGLTTLTLAMVYRLVNEDKPSVAASWLKSIQKILGEEKYAKELKKIKSVRLNEKSSAPQAWAIQRGSAVPAAIIFFLAAWSLIRLYRFSRPMIAGILFRNWVLTVDGKIATFRWLTLLFIVYWGAWLKRFLIIGMIPYSGIAAIPDYGRILMAESLVIVFYVALAWQLQKWDPFPCRVPAKEDRTENPSSAGCIVFLAGISIFPALMEMLTGNTFPSPISGREFLVTFLSNSMTVLASSYLIWKTTIRWCVIFPKTNLWYPAVLFAILRGGISFDPAGSLFLLFFGRILGEIASRERNLTLCIGIDFLCMLPNFLIIPEFFIALDPVGGLFWKIRNNSIFWVVPAIESLLAIVFLNKTQDTIRVEGSTKPV